MHRDRRGNHGVWESRFVVVIIIIIDFVFVRVELLDGR